MKKYLLLLMLLAMAAPRLLFADDNIKLRVVAVNPSAEKTQTVPIKIYLPKEVIPDDIIDMGELKVGYDSEKSLYYAFSDGVDLAPQETRVFEVSLEDVWKVPKEDLDHTRERTALAVKRLESTEYYAKAKSIVESIDKKLEQIEAKQNDQSISREEHIGAYRVNQLVMGQIDKDIEILEKMLQHTGAPASIELLKDTIFEAKDDIDRITAWKVIFAILGFLGFVGIGFYLRWFLMLKSSRTPTKSSKSYAAPKVSEQVEDKPNRGEHGDDGEQVDIEKIMESEDQNKRKAG